MNTSGTAVCYWHVQGHISSSKVAQPLWGGQVPWEQHNSSAIGKFQEAGCEQGRMSEGWPGRRGMVHCREGEEILQPGLKHCHSLQINVQVWDFMSWCQAKSLSFFPSNIFFFNCRISPSEEGWEAQQRLCLRESVLDWWIGVTADTWQTFIDL